MNLIEVINEALHVREHYDSLALRSYPLSVDFYVDQVISPYTGFTVHVKTPKKGTLWQSDKIRGFMLREDAKKTATIIAARLKVNPDDTHGVTYCERRFIVIKEACHLFIDSPQSYTTNAATLIDSLIFSNQKPLPEHSQSENYAAIAALELLFPWEDREARRNLVKAGDKTYFEIAEEYRIPERFVHWVLRDDINAELQRYHDSIDAIKNPGH